MTRPHHLYRYLKDGYWYLPLDSGLFWNNGYLPARYFELDGVIRLLKDRNLHARGQGVAKLSFSKKPITAVRLVFLGETDSEKCDGLEKWWRKLTRRSTHHQKEGVHPSAGITSDSSLFNENEYAIMRAFLASRKQIWNVASRVLLFASIVETMMNKNDASRSTRWAFRVRFQPEIPSEFQRHLLLLFIIIIHIFVNVLNQAVGFIFAFLLFFVCCFPIKGYWVFPKRSLDFKTVNSRYYQSTERLYWCLTGFYQWLIIVGPHFECGQSIVWFVFVLW